MRISPNESRPGSVDVNITIEDLEFLSPHSYINVCAYMNVYVCVYVMQN